MKIENNQILKKEYKNHYVSFKKYESIIAKYIEPDIFYDKMIFYDFFQENLFWKKLLKYVILFY